MVFTIFEMIQEPEGKLINVVFLFAINPHMTGGVNPAHSKMYYAVQNSHFESRMIQDLSLVANGTNGRSLRIDSKTQTYKVD